MALARIFAALAMSLVGMASCKRAEPEKIQAEGALEVDALTPDALSARLERAGFRILMRAPNGTLLFARHKGGKEAGVAPEISVILLPKDAAGLMPGAGYAEANGKQSTLRLKVEGEDPSVLTAAMGRTPEESHPAMAKRFLAAVLAGTPAAAIEPMPKAATLPADFRVPLPDDRVVVRVWTNAVHVTSAQSVDELRKYFERSLADVGCSPSAAPLAPRPENASGATPLPRAALAWRGRSRDAARIELTAIDDKVTLIEVRAKQGFEPRRRDAASASLPAPASLPALSKEARALQADERCMTLHDCGRYREAAHACAEAIRRDPKDTLHRYNLACTLARAGDVDGSLIALEQLKSCGTGECARTLASAELDDDLQSLTKEPRFRALVGWARARRPKQ